jgi:putative ABC transport system permease protein
VRSSNVSIDDNGTPVRIHIQNVTPSFFELLRVPAALGRTFATDEEKPGDEKKVILSYAMWESRFGCDRNVVGRYLRMDGQPYTIVGVMPQSFEYGNADTALWRLGRLRPGRIVAQAQAELDALNRPKREFGSMSLWRQRERSNVLFYLGESADVWQGMLIGPTNVGISIHRP